MNEKLVDKIYKNRPSVKNILSFSEKFHSYYREDDLKKYHGIDFPQYGEIVRFCINLVLISLFIFMIPFLILTKIYYTTSRLVKSKSTK